MHVVGIGHIVTGQSGNGEIKPGATIMLNDDQQQAFIVDAVEQIEYAEDHTAETALILEAVKGEATELLINISSAQILTIASPL